MKEKCGKVFIDGAKISHQIMAIHRACTYLALPTSGSLKRQIHYKIFSIHSAIHYVIVIYIIGKHKN